MARRENWSVAELIVTKGIRAGKLLKLHKVLKMFVVTPAAKIANRYVTSVVMGNKTYTLANTAPGDGLAHSVTAAETAVDVEDTNGILTITGKDVDGKVISEVLTPDAGVTVESTKCFKEITSIVGSGWTQGGTGPDTIVIGFGDKIGLPDKLPSAEDILLVGFDTALVNAPTVAVDANVLSKNCITVVGDGTKKLRAIYQV